MNNPEAKTGEIMPKEAVVTEARKKTIAVTRGWVTDDKLAALRDQFKNITATNPKGYKACTKAIATVRGFRTRLEKSRLEKNKGDHEKIALRNTEAKRITAVLLEIETPLKEMKRLEDERAAKEKAEKERVEKERVDAIKQRIEDNFGQHQIDDLADKRSTYTQARIRIIEAYQVDDSYEEFQEKAAFFRENLLLRVRHIYVAQHDQEQAGKHLQAEREKLDAEKQKLADEAKRLEEQQKEFEKEMAEWHAKRKAKEETQEEAGQAVEEDSAQELTQESTQDGAGDTEAEEEVQGGQVTDEYPLERPDFKVESVTGPQFYDEPEDEETVEDDMTKTIVWSARQENRIRLVELIRAETGINEFNDNDLTDLFDLAGGMYWSKKFDDPIRYLAGQVRKELELYESIPE